MQVWRKDIYTTHFHPNRILTSRIYGSITILHWCQSVMYLLTWSTSNGSFGLPFIFKRLSHLNLIHLLHTSWSSSSHFNIPQFIHYILYYHSSCNLVSCETAFFVVVAMLTLPSLRARSFSHFPWAHVIEGDMLLSLTFLSIVDYFSSILLLA